MSNQIFIPVLIQVFLTIFLYLRLGVEKSRAVKAGQVNEQRRALYDDAWPEKILQLNNAIRNQFEAPVLFYVLVFIYWSLGQENFVFLLTAWIFVLSRLAHAWIHAGSNFVPLRKKIFMFGSLVLMFMAVIVSYQLAVSL